MKQERKVMLEAIKKALSAYTGRESVVNKEDYKVLWYCFRKYCKRNPNVISRCTLREIEKREWMTVSQAQKFCKYAGIECPK